MKNFIEPYDTLVEIGPHLYCLDGDWEKMVFRRRMTVMKLATGDLVVHNAIRMKDEDYAQLDSLGPVWVIIAPNFFHGSDAHFYKTRYPNAKLYVSQAAAKSILKLCKIDGILPGSWPASLKSEVECIEFKGTRFLNETVFVHHPSKTLITTDLVFNMQGTFNGIETSLLKINKIYNRFGPSRVFRYGFVNNKKLAVESVTEILKWDFDRVIMNHGKILSAGGKEAFKRGFQEIGLA